jgi:hypothetical protein
MAKSDHTDLNRSSKYRQIAQNRRRTRVLALYIALRAGRNDRAKRDNKIQHDGLVAGK